jgi:predicted ATPase
VVFSIEEQRFEAPPNSVAEEEPLLSVAGGPFAANRVAGQFRDEVASWGVYQGFHTHREAPVRQPAVARSETRVQQDGQNLISVLHTLYTGDRDFKTELDIAMRSAFGDDFEELVFPPAADQRIQLRVRWKSLQREQSGADLSDGTLRFLFLIAIFANPKPPALIAIDEPETGLHPSMLPIVAEYARDAAARTQVILTTHSPEFLDACGKEAPTTTVLDWKHGETELRVLAGDRLDYWLNKYTLGELYRSSELEAME